MKNINHYRNFLKAKWEMWEELDRDQEKDIPAPPRQKSVPEEVELIKLPDIKKVELSTDSITEIISKRRSRRRYKDNPLSMEELSFILWSAQGVNSENKNLRNVPSAGARHPFETYLIINKVEGLIPGIYRYIPFEHSLIFNKKLEDVEVEMSTICLDQKFVKRCAVLFVWTVIPYRTEWRYSILSHKVIAMDAGHLCQNVYLASEAIGAGTCAIGAYDQDETDKLLEVDGEEEFTIYLASVGKIK